MHANPLAEKMAGTARRVAIAMGGPAASGGDASHALLQKCDREVMGNRMAREKSISCSKSHVESENGSEKSRMN